jgi:hypothetical protein
MLRVVPHCPDQLEELFDHDGTLKSVRTVSKISEGRKTAKDSIFRNWLRAAFVAKDLNNNADSTSRLQIEPEFPATFTAEQSATFYTDLAIIFDEENHTFGTTIANGILPQCTSPNFRSTAGTGSNRHWHRPQHQTMSRSRHNQ